MLLKDAYLVYFIDTYYSSFLHLVCLDFIKIPIERKVSHVYIYLHSLVKHSFQSAYICDKYKGTGYKYLNNKQPRTQHWTILFSESTDIFLISSKIRVLWYGINSRTWFAVFCIFKTFWKPKHAFINSHRFQVVFNC